MRALVSGHEGFVGRHLLPLLRDAGYEVTGTEDFTGFSDYYVGDPFDVVIHLGANIINVDERGKIGIIAFQDILLDYEVCRWVEMFPPKKAFVVMSSCAVDFPDDPYCIVKRTLEAFAQSLHRHGLPVVILRPYSGYGADQSLEYPFRAIFERALRKEDPLTVWGGRQVRDWIHISDLARAIVMAIEDFPRGTPIQIGSGLGTSLFDLARMIATECGYSPVIAADETKTVSSPSRIAHTGLASLHGWRFRMTLKEGIAMATAQLRVAAYARQNRVLSNMKQEDGK